jgi:hypothetical protein
MGSVPAFAGGGATVLAGGAGVVLAGGGGVVFAIYTNKTFDDINAMIEMNDPRL